jgi:hypothetical protein
MQRNKLLVSLSVLSIILAPLTLHAAKSATTSNRNVNVTIPNVRSNSGFEFNIGPVWLKPGASNLNYVIYNKELPVQSPGWSEHELLPSFTTGLDLGFRYIFPNGGGNDIKLDWTHLSTSNSAATSAPDASFFLGPDYEIGPNGLYIRNATGNVKFKYDVVNGDVGQFAGFGQHMQMRFFGGLSGGFLREQVTANYSGNLTTGTYPGPFTMNQVVTSNFTGVGPRFGIEADYNTYYGFGFLGEFAASALMGTMYSKTNYAGTSQQLITQYNQALNNQIIEDQKVYQVIPGVDAKLGVNYKHVFNNKTLLKITAGYQAAVYINAISQYLPASLVSGQSLTSGGIFVATMSHQLSNYSVQGPFLNFAVEI